jgi:hypothetical protein
MKLEITVSSVTKSHQKARFALATPTFLFTNIKNEIQGVMDIWTTSQQNLRLLYWKLSPESKQKLVGVMRTFFSVSNVYQSSEPLKEGFAIMITEQNGLQLEVALVGSAFQRVFSLFILFYTLVDAEESMKILLVEELESLLYPSLVRLVFNHLFTLVITHNVQLIVTSNCPEIINSVPPKQCIILSSESPKICDHQCDIELSQLLNVPTNKSVLVVDGPNDVIFFFLPQVAANYQLISLTKEGYKRGSNIPLETTKFLNSFVNSHKVAFLHDREFFPSARMALRLRKKRRLYPTRILFIGIFLVLSPT